MERGGVKVVVLMRRVAIGRIAGGVEQAVGIRCRQEWHRHRMSRDGHHNLNCAKLKQAKLKLKPDPDEQGTAGRHYRAEGASRWW